MSELTRVEERLVTVCDKCLMASCWHGTFMCDDAQGAGLIEKTVAELEKLGREHASYWFTDPATGQLDSQAFADYEERA
jgi:hypothetical protein